MSRVAPSPDEQQLTTLRRYDILDTPPEPAFDRVARVAARLLDAPMAMIGFAESQRQWIKAEIGLSRHAVPTDHPLFALPLRDDTPHVVEDASADSRFANAPLVDTAPGIRSYVGVPLVSPGGHTIGTLAVMDTEPRSIAEDDIAALEDLAAMVIDELESQRSAGPEASAALSNDELQQLADRIPGILYQFVARPDGTREFRYGSAQAESLLGLSPEADDLFEQALRRIPESHREAVRASNEAAIAEAAPWSAEFPFVLPSGERIWLKGQSLPQQRGDELVYHGLFLDVTAQKEAENDLRETKHLLEKTLESLKEAVFVIDPADRSIVACNSAVESIFGYEKSELIGETTETLHIDREAYERFAEENEPVLEERGAFNGTYEMQRKDGERLVTEHTITPLHPDDWSRGVVSVVRDVTDQTERERELRRSRDLLKQTQRLAGGWEYDARSDSLHWTEEVYHIYEQPLDYEPSFELGQKYVLPEDRGTLDDALDRAIEHDAPFDISIRIRTAKDNRRWVRIIGEAFTEAGEVVKMAGAIQDITERKEAERQMRLQTEALDAAANAIAITDAEGVIEWVNPAFTTLTGYSEDEALGQSMKLLNSGEQDAAFYQDLWATVTSGHVWHGELTNQRKDGTLYIEEQTITPVRNENDEIHHFIAIKQDITDRKRREQELIAAKEAAEKARTAAEAAQAEAEEMNRLKSALLANMSHEIRTPLTSIIGFSEVLAGLDLDPPAERFTEMIQRGGQRLLNTLNSVLDLSQLEAGAMTLHPEEMAVGPLVRDVASTFMLRAEEVGVDLHVETPRSGTTAYLDPGALERIVSNLVSNAIKFTGEGRATGGSVTVTLDTAPETITLEVADTGVGIDPAFVPHLFDAFKQESTGDARDFEGSGLGLTITRELVDLMGGTIDVETAKGEGTTFTVTLPRERE